MVIGLTFICGVIKGGHGDGEERVGVPSQVPAVNNAHVEDPDNVVHG